MSPSLHHHSHSTLLPLACLLQMLLHETLLCAKPARAPLALRNERILQVITDTGRGDLPMTLLSGGGVKDCKKALTAFPRYQMACASSFIAPCKAKTTVEQIGFALRRRSSRGFISSACKYKHVCKSNNELVSELFNWEEKNILDCTCLAEKSDDCKLPDSTGCMLHSTIF